MTLFELTKELINIPSVSGEEQKVADFLSAYLRNQGFGICEQTISGNRRNILATAVQNPKVLFCTHMDTVPPFFSASEDENFIYGRGACDTKGIIAAMIFACQGLTETGTTEAGLLFVVGEETDSVGAKTANSLNVHSDYIIVGEPTENKLGTGHKGIVALRLSSQGKSAHSAYPDQGESAIERLLDALQEIRAINFGEAELGQSTLNIGTITGGSAHNVIPHSASAEISVRNVTSSNTILKKINETIDDSITIEILTRSEPQKIHTIPEFEQTVVAFGTDIPHLKTFGKPLLIGPGSILVAHTPDERIEKRQLTEAVRIYLALAQKLLEQ